MCLVHGALLQLHEKSLAGHLVICALPLPHLDTVPDQCSQATVHTSFHQLDGPQVVQRNGILKVGKLLVQGAQRLICDYHYGACGRPPVSKGSPGPQQLPL